MTGSNPTGGNIERKPAITTEITESNLSETAQLVNLMLKDYIMPELRAQPASKEAKSLLEIANGIIRDKLQPDDQRVIEFALACRALQAKIHAKAEQDGCDDKRIAVVDNYFSKLITTIKCSSETYQPETPKEMAA